MWMKQTSVWSRKDLTPTLPWMPIPNANFRLKSCRFGLMPPPRTGVVTYETIMTCDNADLALRPGMTATADIIVKQADQALSVPSAALRFSMPKPEENKSSPSLLRMFMPGPPGAATGRPNMSPSQAAMTRKPYGFWTKTSGQGLYL